MTVPVEFVQIVPLEKQFGLEASRGFPLEDRVADSEDALIGRLVREFPNMPEGTVVDIETLEHKHISLSNMAMPALMAS